MPGTVCAVQVYAMDGLPSAAVRRLKKLKVLKIIGCKAHTLNSSAFEGLSSLEELHLQVSVVLQTILPFVTSPSLWDSVYRLVQNEAEERMHDQQTNHE